MGGPALLEEPLTWKIPLTELMKPVFASLLLWGLGLWIATVFVFQFALFPDWSHPQRARLSAILVMPMAIFMAYLRFSRRCHTVIDRKGFLELGQGFRSKEIPVSQVVGLIGLGGVNLDGDELIVWKNLVILTWDGCEILEFHHQDNAWLYRILRGVCRTAWGLPFNGHLEPPMDGPRNGRGVNSVAIERILGYYRWEVAKTLIATVILLIGALIVILWLIPRAGGDGRIAKGLLWLAIFAAISLLMLRDAWRNSRVLREIDRVRSAI